MYIEEKEVGVLIHLFVQPKSSRNEIVGLHGESLKIKITAPPVDGEANAAVIAFFSKILKIPKGRIEIIRGETSRHKVICVTGLPAIVVREILNLP